MRVFLTVIVALALVAGAFLWVIRAEALEAAAVDAVEPDLARGEVVFHAAGCASCHAAQGAEGDARMVLSGGYRIETPVGVFVAPNISPDPDHGIGNWTRAEVVTALMKGTSPDGRHYFPAFPYAAYGRATLDDMVSLAAFLETLPADPTPSAPHEIGFPYNIRAGVGLWKLANVTDRWAVEVAPEEALLRGRYIAEALGHCGECHTPRTATQGLDVTRWFHGAANPSGSKGRIPAITPDKLTWSEKEIADYLTSGFTPEFDVAAGTMASVVKNLAQIPPEDVAALALYLKAVPPAE